MTLKAAENVYFASSEVYQKIDRIKYSPKDDIQVFSDFDGTLSRGKTRDGKRSDDTYSMFRFFNEHAKQEIERQERAFMENLSNSSISEKTRNLRYENIWREYHQKIAQLGVTVEALNDLVRKSGIDMKDDIGPFFDKLIANGIRLTIVTAGLVQGIHAVLKVRGYENYIGKIDFIGNSAVVSDGGVIRAFPDPHVIHVGNKRNYVKKRLNQRCSSGKLKILGRYFKVGLQKCHIFTCLPTESHTSKPNIIVLGDSLGDAPMADGVAHREIVKIGFLHDSSGEKRRKFLENFDIVIEGEESLEWVNSLLSYILVD